MFSSALPPSIYSDTANSNIRVTSLTTDKLSVLNQVLTADFSVNQAAVKTIGNGYPMLQTRVFTNDAGAFNGSGTGNKAIFGIDITGPLRDFESIEIVYQNLQGDVESIFGGAASNQSPYVNLQVDLDGDNSNVLLFSMINYVSIPPPLSGIYEILDAPRTYKVSWNNTLAVNVVGVTSGSDLGGITPVYSGGVNWQAIYWSFQDIVDANPNAVIINYASEDGGFPIDCVVAGLSINSGDSSQQVFSSKLIRGLKINDHILYE